VDKTDAQCFDGVGSGLLSLDTQESEILNAIFGELLDSSVALDAVSYEGLANARISLLDLLEADGSAGTGDDATAVTIAVMAPVGVAPVIVLGRAFVASTVGFALARGIRERVAPFPVTETTL
jgi:uncharacterized membrane protein